MNRADVLGKEFDWFAVDAEGRVALMASAGFGAVPDAVFERIDAQTAFVQRLRAFGALPDDRALPEVIDLLCELGIFVYDWQHWQGPYRRIAVPARPLHFDDLALPPALRCAAVQLPDVQFSEQRDLRPETLVPCTHD